MPTRSSLQRPRRDPAGSPPPKSQPTPRRQHTLLKERELAAAEATLRTAYRATDRGDLLVSALENLGDAYIARVAGHQGDNVRCALTTYLLAAARVRAASREKGENVQSGNNDGKLEGRDEDNTMQRGRIISKAGGAWLRLRSVSAECHSGDGGRMLRRADALLDEGVALFEQAGAAVGRTPWFMEAGFERGVACEALSRDERLDDVERGRLAEEAVRRLEGALGAKGGVVGQGRVRGLLCLARVYAGGEGGRIGLQNGLRALEEVEEILGDGGEDRVKEEVREVGNMLAERSRGVESRCIIC